MANKKAFTLIELLIVVAIIGILAAIAVPNFLNAQIRAKVARSVSDLKAIESALETYKIDKGQYPEWTIRGGHPIIVRYIFLTTPIAYLPSVPHDPFFRATNNPDAENYGDAYDYVNAAADQSNKDWLCLWGHWWRISVNGPDGRCDWGGCRETRDGRKGRFHCDSGIPNFLYQSSNGLVSDGDLVWVGQRNERSVIRCRIINGI